jgi:hypothetical protein
MYLNETYSKVRIRKHLSDAFPIQSGLKQGDALALLFLSFALEYAVRKVWNRVGTHQFLVYADDVNILGEGINSAKKAHGGCLLEAGREIVLEVNTDRLEYVIIFDHHEAR